MKQQFNTLRPEETATLQLRKLYEQYGYKKYRMSRFEEYSLYAANKRFLPSENVITFTDLDGKLLALKPDVTLGIIKNTKATRESSEKLYYVENVYRESKESHTYKEISQMGLECLGTVDLYTIVEVLALAENSLAALGPDFVLTVSHMGIVAGLVENLGVGEGDQKQILSCIRSKNAGELAEISRRVKLSRIQTENLCRIPNLYGDFPSTIRKARKIALNRTMEEACDQLEVVYKAMRSIGLAKNLRLDFSIINDIEYYNGIIFQGYLDGLPRTVLSGGQYDGMTKKMGRDLEAIGFALYLSELRRLPRTASMLDAEALVLYDENADCGKLAAAVKKLSRECGRVRTERTVPAGFRCGAVYRFDGEKLCSVMDESGASAAEKREEAVTC